MQRPGERLQARCDSFVVETDVRYPTDLNLLWDALRCLIRVTALGCTEYGVGGWRQSAHLTRKVRGLFNRVPSSRRRRARKSLEELSGAGADAGIVSAIQYFLDHAERQIDQVERRLVRGETIPRQEKLHASRAAQAVVQKGKAGCPVELGVPVAIVESKHGFVLYSQIMCRSRMWT